MKKLFFTYLLMVLVSCSRETGGNLVCGYIDFGINVDAEMAETKAGTSDFNGYNVTLEKDGGALWTKEYEDIGDADWSVAPGLYRVYAESLSADEAYAADARGQVRLAGVSGKITIYPGKSSPCNVLCTPANTKISFLYTEKFAEAFPDFNVNVSDGVRDFDMEMTLQTPDMDKNLLDVVYFEPGMITWLLKATNTEGRQMIYTRTFSVEPATWTQVCFNASDTFGEIIIEIIVNDDLLDTVTIPAVLNPFE